MPPSPPTSKPSNLSASKIHTYYAYYAIDLYFTTQCSARDYMSFDGNMYHKLNTVALVDHPWLL